MGSTRRERRAHHRSPSQRSSRGVRRRAAVEDHRVLLSDSCVARVRAVDVQECGTALRRPSRGDRTSLLRSTCSVLMSAPASRPLSGWRRTFHQPSGIPSPKSSNTGDTVPPILWLSSSHQPEMSSVAATISSAVRGSTWWRSGSAFLRINASRTDRLNRCRRWSGTSMILLTHGTSISCIRSRGPNTMRGCMAKRFVAS